MKLAPLLTLAALAALLASAAYAGLPATLLTAGAQNGAGGGSDIALKALITAAVIGGSLALGALLYLLRRAIGFDMHRPPEGEEGEAGEH